MRDLILEGNGSSGSSDSDPTLAWISRRHRSWTHFMGLPVDIVSAECAAS